MAQGSRKVISRDDVVYALGYTPSDVLFKGAYDAALAYNTGSIVNYGGSAFVAKSFVPSNHGPQIDADDRPIVSDYWDVFIEKGDTGQDGSLTAEGLAASQTSVGAAVRAETAMAAAELSAGTALTAGKLYASIAHGLAATGNGDFFNVAGTGYTYATTYEHVLGEAVFRTSVPAKSLIDTIRSYAPVVNDDSGFSWRHVDFNDANEIIGGIDENGDQWGVSGGELVKLQPVTQKYVPDFNFILDSSYPYAKASGYGIPTDQTWHVFIHIDQSFGLGSAGVTNFTGEITDATSVITASISGTVMTVTDAGDVGVINGATLSAFGVLPDTIIVEQLGDPDTWIRQGVGTYRVSKAQNVVSTPIISIIGRLTATSVPIGTIAVPDIIRGANVTEGTYVSDYGTATGHTGTYYVRGDLSASSTAMTAGINPIATPNPLDTKSWQLGDVATGHYYPAYVNYTELKPLTGSGRQGIGPSLCHYIQDQLSKTPNGQEVNIVYQAVALGGCRIDQLWPGTQEYDNIIYYMTQINDRIVEQGGQPVIHFVTCHGHANSKENWTKEEFINGWTAFLGHLRNTAMSITGQKMTPFLFASQTDEFYGSYPAALWGYEVSDATLALSERDPYVRCVGPIYNYERQYNDRVHDSANKGFVQHGESFGACIYRTLFDQSRPLSAGKSPKQSCAVRHLWWAQGVAHAWDDLILEYPYDMVIDTSNEVVFADTLGSGLGINVTDGPLGAERIIESVAIVSGFANRIRVTFAADPKTIRSPFIYIAKKRTPGPNLSLQGGFDYSDYTGPIYGPRSCLREVNPIALGVTDGTNTYVTLAVDTYGNPVGQNLYRWACMQTLQIGRAL